MFRAGRFSRSGFRSDDIVGLTQCKQSVSCGKNKIKAKILPVGYGAVFGAEVFFGFSPLAFFWMGWYTKGKI